MSPMCPQGPGSAFLRPRPPARGIGRITSKRDDIGCPPPSRPGSYRSILHTQHKDVAPGGLSEMFLQDVAQMARRRCATLRTNTFRGSSVRKSTLRNPLNAASPSVSISCTTELWRKNESLSPNAAHIQTTLGGLGRRWVKLTLPVSILCLQSRFVFGNKPANLITHVQKFQPLLFVQSHRKASHSVN
jgi:hypothetical protein